MIALLICFSSLLALWLIIVETRFYVTRDDYNEKRIAQLTESLAAARRRHPDDPELWQWR